MGAARTMIDTNTVMILTAILTALFVAWLVQR